MSGRLYYWVASTSLSRAEAALLLGPHGVADMVDCTHSALERVLPELGPHGIQRIAAYVTGTPDIRWTPADFDKIPPDCAVLRIDQSNSNLPLEADVKLAKDVEPGASDPHEAVLVAGERLHHGEDYTIYVDQAELHAVEDHVALAGLPHGRIVAYQWASPTSNPHTRLPGSFLTLAEANADLSVVDESWLPLPGGRTPQKPSPRPAPATVDFLDVAKVTFDRDSGEWTIAGLPGEHRPETR